MRPVRVLRSARHRVLDSIRAVALVLEHLLEASSRRGSTGKLTAFLKRISGPAFPQQTFAPATTTPTDFWPGGRLGG